MKMKLNRITTSLVSALFVFVMVSCDLGNLQVPSSVRIKSSPGLYVSLGSPFDAGEGMSLNQYLSVDGLKEQLGGENKQNLDIIEYIVPSDEKMQAYRVRYPVADININLSEYVEQMDVASNLSDAEGQWIPGTGSEIEIPLPLDSMSFAHDVTEVEISVTLKFYTPTTPTEPPPKGEQGNDVVPTNGVKVTFKGAVFNNSGDPEPEGNKWTSPEIAEFQPATDKVSIGVTVPLGTWFSPQLSFDWEQAAISLGEAKEEGTEDTQEGMYELDFSGFGEFMGNGVSFKEISGYMYLATPDTNDLKAEAEYRLTWDKGTEKTEVAVTPVEEALSGWKQNFTAPADTYKIDLTNLFKYPLEFSYELKLTRVTIKKEDNKAGKISVDMVILLPLEFTLDDTLVSSNFKDATNTPYKKLELGMLQDSVGDGGDLFGRTGSDEDDVFKNLESVTIYFSNYTNGMIEGLAFGVLLKDGENELLTEERLKDGDGKLTLDADDIAYPFSPKFELLVKNEETLKILKDEAGKGIDLSIAVEVKTDLDYQVEF
ncbi:MAG: hypothetical protein LBD79_01170 [Treponema sp.]|jgi:hypothetical protein|nr:hypothetical protein [Treponema sp.]